MKQIFSISLLLLLGFFAKAQTNVKIVVTDAKTGKPVERATIATDKKNMLVTNDEGNAELNSKSSVTSLHITASGFEPKDVVVEKFNGLISILLQPKSLLLQPVEVNAIRAGDKSPFTKTNLSKSYVEDNNLGQDLPFLLNQTPNVVINSDAGNGIGYTALRIRGTDATRINMTINGIPYNDAEDQGTYFVDLPDFASSVSSIQVQRGVGTSSAGAGAFGATMNFSTNEYNDKFGVELNNSYGSFNSWKNTVKLSSGLVGGHFTFDARYSNIRSDGYIDRAKSNLESGFFSAAYYDKKTTIRFNMLLGKEKTYQAWDGVPQDSLATHRTYNDLGLEPNGTFYKNQTDNYIQNQYQLFINQSLSHNWVFNTGIFWTPGKGYYEEYKAGQTLLDYNIQPVKVGSSIDSTSDLVRQLWLNNDYFGQIFSFQQKTKKDELTFGGGWNRYTGAHYGQVVWTQVQPNIFSRYYYLDADKTDINFYAKWQHQLSANFDGFADLQYRNVRYNIYGFQYNPDIIIHAKYNFINPKAGISFHQKDWSGYLSYALANKEPNRDDFEANQNQQPKREQLNDFELNIKKKNIFKGFDIAATGYYMLYKDQLILTGQINDVGAYTRTNTPNSYRLGTELEMNYHASKWNLGYNLALSQNKIKNFTEYVDNYDNGGQNAINHGTTTIAFSPSIVQGLTLNVLPVKNWELTWLGKNVGKEFMDNTSSDDRKLKAFVVNDFRTSYTIHYGLLKEAKLIFQLNNIFNVKYEPNGYTYSYISGGVYNYENSYFPMAGTNVMVALNVKL
jgi:iron complex outermembrane receptor protein